MIENIQEECKRIKFILDNKFTSEAILVSVVVIAYNEEKRILPCILSLSEQDLDVGYEILVVNNASTDNTQLLLDACGVKSVYEAQKGVGFARQAGLDAANGKFHFTADADTIYPPTYIRTMLSELNKPDVSAVFTHCRFLQDGKKSVVSLRIYEFFRNIVVRLRARHRPELAVGGASMGFITEYGRKIGFRTDIKRGEDGAMIFLLKNFGKIILVKRRQAYVLTSSRTLDADGGFLQVILKRLIREIRRSGSYFYPKKEYKDRITNLINQK